MANANTLDFLGGGSSSGSLQNPQALAPFDVDPATLVNSGQGRSGVSGFIGPTSVSGGATGDPLAALRASQGGNIGGAAGAYNAGNDATRTAEDATHATNGGASKDTWSSVVNSTPVKLARSIVDPIYGGTQLAKAVLPGKVTNTIDDIGNAINAPVATGLQKIGAPDAVQAIADPLGYGRKTVMGSPSQGSLGITGGVDLLPGNGNVAQAYGNIKNDVNNAAGAASNIGATLNKPLDGSSTTFDTTGADRGSSKIPGIDDAAQINNANALAGNASARGGQVLSGQVAPGGQGAQGQQDALDRLLAFNPTAQQSQLAATQAYNPTAQSGVMGKLDAFTAQPQGPSAAQTQLQQGNQAAMSDALSVARSGRARDAGSQARATQVATAENAGTNVDAARNAATLKASEDQAFRAQQLQALGQQGTLAGGVDQSKLTALGQGNALAAGLDQSKLTALGQSSDVANQIRSGNTTERGQSLGYDTAAQQTGATLTGDALKTIPAIEGVNHSDAFSLTPQQQLAEAQMGHKPATTLDTILGLGKDILPLL